MHPRSSSRKSNAIALSAALLVFAQSPFAFAQTTFNPALTYPAGSSPIAIAAGDFNGDGRADVVTANIADDTVTVFFSALNGALQNAVVYSTGSGPTRVVTGDFDGDDDLDIAVSAGNDNTVSVLLGNGNGVFTAATGFPTGPLTSPTALVTGDFDGDDVLDFATTNGGTGNVSVLLGNGNGTFVAPVYYGSGVALQHLKTADFNGDNKLDLANVDFLTSTINVLLGNGDGTFQPQVPYVSGAGAIFVQAGDLNGDLSLDLVTANISSNSVTVLLGNGDGSFASGVDYAVGSGPRSVAIADYDLDGDLDIAVANRSANTVQVLEGLGNGTFPTLTSPLTVGASPQMLVAADLDLDQKLDLVTTNVSSNDVSVLTNTTIVTDTDMDGIRDSLDPDDDNDGSTDVQETADGTNPLNAQEFIEHGGPEYCLEWNGFLSALPQVLELRNAGNTALALRVDLHAKNGTVQSSLNVSVGAGLQRDVYVNALVGFIPQSYGIVCAVVTAGSADSLDAQLSVYDTLLASFSFGFTTQHHVGRTGQQYVSYNHIYPTLKPAQSGNFAGGFAQVSNEETTTESGELIFYDAEGYEAKRAAVTIPGKGRADVDSHSLGANKVGLVVWNPLANNKRFRVVLNRYYSDRPVGGALVGAVALPAQRASSQFRAIPFDSRSRIAVLELSNTEASPIGIDVTTFDASGQATPTQPGDTRSLPSGRISIPARGTRHVVLNQTSPAGLGTVLVRGVSSEPDRFTATVLEYGLDDSQGFAFVSAGELKSGFGTVQRVSYNSFLGGFFLRLSNIGGSAETASISMTRYDGTALLTNAPVLIPAFGATEFDICGNETQIAYGEVEITPSQTETLVGEMVRTNQDGSAGFRLSLRER